MDGRYLEVTYREGRVVAAYLHRPRPDEINAVLAKVGVSALDPAELAPLAA